MRPLIWSVQTIETDSRWALAWGWREEVALNGGVFFWGNENALELDSGGISTTLWIYSTPQDYTFFKWFKWWILCYVNVISRKHTTVFKANAQGRNTGWWNTQLGGATWRSVLTPLHGLGQVWGPSSSSLRFCRGGGWCGNILLGWGYLLAASMLTCSRGSQGSRQTRPETVLTGRRYTDSGDRAVGYGFGVFPRKI